MRVLELGCSSGDLLAAMQPARGVGVDFSPAIIEQARRRHPQLEFHVADAGKFWLLTSPDQMITTFNQIGVGLSKLRIAN